MVKVEFVQIRKLWKQVLLSMCVALSCALPTSAELSVVKSEGFESRGNDINDIRQPGLPPEALLRTM